MRTAEYCVQRVVIVRAPAQKRGSESWFISSSISKVIMKRAFRTQLPAHWLVVVPSSKFSPTRHIRTSSKGIVSNVKGNHLLDQIKIFKEAGAPNLHSSIPKLANDKRQALVDASFLRRVCGLLIGLKIGSLMVRTLVLKI